MAALLGCLGGSTAAAEPHSAELGDSPTSSPSPRRPTAPTGRTSTAGLDGTYLALGPIGAATRTEDDWDSAFGGEVFLARVRESRWLGAIGLTAGAIGFGERDGGRAWGDLLVASRRPLGFALGLSAGVTAELHPVRPPRWGGHATLFAFAGAMPYVQLGTVQRSGGYLEVGIKMPLPALRWGP